jgi:hypothetical protein
MRGSELRDDTSFRHPCGWDIEEGARGGAVDLEHLPPALRGLAIYLTTPVSASRCGPAYGRDMGGAA